MADVEPLEAFRSEVQDWLSDNFDPALKGRHNPMGMVDGPTDMSPDMVAWREALGERGFGVPSWPKEYGGAGLSPQQIAVLDEEMRKDDRRTGHNGEKYSRQSRWHLRLPPGNREKRQGITEETAGHKKQKMPALKAKPTPLDQHRRPKQSGTQAQANADNFQWAELGDRHFGQGR